MSHTLDSVLKKLTDAYVSGGTVIVFRNGKHTNVGQLNQSTGAFNLTADGLDLLGEGPVTIEMEPADEKPVVKTATKKTGKQTAKQAEELTPEADAAAADLAALDSIDDLLAE